MEDDRKELQAEFTSLGEAYKKYGRDYTDGRVAKVEKRMAEIVSVLADMKRPDLRTTTAGFSDPETRAFVDWMRRGGQAPEVRALQIGSDPSAGYLAPAELSSEIYHELAEVNPMRGLARAYQTDKNSLEILKKIASGSVVYRATDVSAIVETTGMAYGKLIFTPKEYVYWLEISRQNLEDSIFPVEKEVTQEMGEQFGFFEAGEMVNGTEGLIQNVGDGSGNTYPLMKSGSTTDITANNLVDLSLNIPARYLAGAKWMMNRGTLSVIRQIQDAVTGVFLMSPLNSGPSELLCGYPIVINDHMPAATSALFPICFGSLNKGFAIVDRFPSLRIDRLNEIRAAYGIVVFNGSMRATWGPLDGAALTFLQMSV